MTYWAHKLLISHIWTYLDNTQIKGMSISNYLLHSRPQPWVIGWIAEINTLLYLDPRRSCSWSRSCFHTETKISFKLKVKIWDSVFIYLPLGCGRGQGSGLSQAKFKILAVQPCGQNFGETWQRPWSKNFEIATSQIKNVLVRIREREGNTQIRCSVLMITRKVLLESSTLKNEESWDKVFLSLTKKTSLRL